MQALRMGVNILNVRKQLLSHGLPGRTMSVGSDNLSSPTTKSERTGVYLWQIVGQTENGKKQ